MLFSSNNSIPSVLNQKDYSLLEKSFNIGSKICILMSVILIAYITARVING